MPFDDHESFDDAQFWGDDLGVPLPENAPPEAVELVKPPSNLLARGKRLFESVVGEFALAEHELSVLEEAARTLDTVTRLERILAKEGLIVASPQGSKAHPALVEIRQQRTVFARLVASLRIPLSDAQEAGRLPQRRAGVRAPKGVS